MKQLVLHFEVSTERGLVRPPRPFDFSRVKLYPSRGDIQAACIYWARECRLLGLDKPDKGPKGA